MSVPAANVRTKSVYEPADPSGEGRRVLVTQYWPRGIPKTAVDEYVRKLGPSRELLHAFKGGEIDWEAYKVRYLEEMGGEDAKSEIQRLADLARSQTITVVCVCKDGQRCHRTLLRELILDATSARMKPEGLRLDLL